MIGMEPPILSEQHSQLISWSMLIPREYVQLRSLPEQVGFNWSLGGKVKDYLMAWSPTRESLAGTPLICLWNIDPPSEVDDPLDLIVTVLLMLTLIQFIFASQFVLSTSMTIWTNSPGMYPSFSKWMSALEIPLLKQQQLVIYPCEVFCWVFTILLYLKVIYLENFISAPFAIP